MNQPAVPSSYKDDGWNACDAHKNERVELEMTIMKYRRWTHQIADEDFQKRLRERIAELERKLREIDG
jgi:hypothetical protein